jgi:PAS domain S-box-containing protein
MEQSADPIFIVDIQSKQVLEANSAFRNMLGYSAEEMAVINLFDVTDGISMDVGKEIDEILKNKHAFEGERQYHRKDGTPVLIWMSASVITYRGQKALCIVARDITERRRIQDELKKSVRTLKKTLEGVTSTISAIIKTKDPYTADHQLRVSKLACAIAQEMGLSEDRIEGLQTAALMHDLGKIYLPAELLAKPEQLNEMEMNLFKNHPQDGYNRSSSSITSGSTVRVIPWGYPGPRS